MAADPVVPRSPSLYRKVAEDIIDAVPASAEDARLLGIRPRAPWGGDTNFMPVTGRTRVLPQLLADTRKLLAEAWPAA